MKTNILKRGTRFPVYTYRVSSKGVKGQETPHEADIGLKDGQLIGLKYRNSTLD